ncbi:ABC transporter permease [Rhodoligotrophos ferricapiens]|uniref:ABC transporter permease n=1 Tax=Rhodoligotrophos ferricapiens TaxID=3069264 RepID=UPI00315DF9B5
MASRSALLLSPPARLVLMSPILLVILGFFFAIGGLIVSSFSSEGILSLDLYERLLSSPATRAVLFRTMWVAAAVTLLCLVLSYPVALFLQKAKHRNLLLILIISPLLTSVVVRTFAWLVVLGNRGALNALLLGLGILQEPAKIMFTPYAVVIGLTHILMPFMIISILATLQQQEEELVEAGMSLGAGRLQTFARVTFPLSLPGVLSGCSLVYILCAGAIVTPLLLGGVRDRMLGTDIYEDIIQLFDFDRATGMAVILFVSTMIAVIPIMWAEALIRRRMKG